MKIKKSELKQIIREVILNEGKELSPDKIKAIADMTNINDHTGARVFLSHEIKNKNLEDSYGALYTLNNYFGYMPQELLKIREMLDKRLFKLTKQKFSNHPQIKDEF